MAGLLASSAFFAADAASDGDIAADVVGRTELNPDSDALGGLRDDRQLFSLGRMRLFAQLPVELRQLPVVHDHASGLGSIVRDELLDRVGL